MIIHKNKIIFIHIPKTAGFSIEKFLYGKNIDSSFFHEDIVYGLKDGKYTQHLEYESIKNYYKGKENIENYFKFAFVRNTWDRLLSAYSYLNPNPDKKSFCDYLKRKCKILQENKLSECDHYNTQIRYVFKNDKKILDFIGIFENIQEDFKNLCKIVSIEHKPLPIMNHSKRKNYQEYYDTETINIVKETYKKEIEYFDFKF